MWWIEAGQSPAGSPSAGQMAGSGCRATARGMAASVPGSATTMIVFMIMVRVEETVLTTTAGLRAVVCGAIHAALTQIES